MWWSGTTCCEDKSGCSLTDALSCRVCILAMSVHSRSSKVPVRFIKHTVFLIFICKFMWRSNMVRRNLPQIHKDYEVWVGKERIWIAYNILITAFCKRSKHLKRKKGTKTEHLVMQMVMLRNDFFYHKLWYPIWKTLQKMGYKSWGLGRLSLARVLQMLSRGWRTWQNPKAKC